MENDRLLFQPLIQLNDKMTNLHRKPDEVEFISICTKNFHFFSFFGLLVIRRCPFPALRNNLINICILPVTNLQRYKDLYGK